MSEFTNISVKKPEWGLFRQLQDDDESNSSLMLALLLCADQRTLTEARDLLSEVDRETSLLMVAEERGLSLAPEDIGLTSDTDPDSGVKVATDGGVPHRE